MQRIVVLATACALALYTGPFARAAAPTVVPLQGILTDAAGEPIIGARTITFSLYDDHTAGNLLWTETQDVILNSGFFFVYLGAIQPLDLITFKEHCDVWLGVTVETDPEFNRIQLGSMPFSAYAQHGSYTPGVGISITAANTVSSTLGITIESDEITDGTITAADLADDSVTTGKIVDGTILRTDLAQDGCTASQILKFDGAGWICSDLDVSLPTLACTTEVCQVTGAVTGCTVTCPEGTTVTGCGVRSNNSNFIRENAFNGNGCRCWIVNIGSQTTTCQARCCRIQ